jgi:hypothetical protein
MMLSRAIACILLIASPAVFAGSVNLNLSSNAAQLEVGYLSNGNSEIQSGFLYNEVGSVMIDTGLIVNGGGGDQGTSSGVSGGGGVKAIAAKIQQATTTNNAAGIALGGQVSFPLPAAPSVALGAEYYTAPGIISFGDADRFTQFGFRVEFGPPNAKFFVGYRELNFHITKTGDVSIDKGGYTGILLTF